MQNPSLVGFLCADTWAPYRAPLQGRLQGPLQGHIGLTKRTLLTGGIYQLHLRVILPCIFVYFSCSLILLCDYYMLYRVICCYFSIQNSSIQTHTCPCALHFHLCKLSNMTPMRHTRGPIGGPIRSPAGGPINRRLFGHNSSPHRSYDMISQQDESYKPPGPP